MKKERGKFCNVPCLMLQKYCKIPVSLHGVIHHYTAMEEEAEYLFMNLNKLDYNHPMREEMLTPTQRIFLKEIFIHFCNFVELIYDTPSKNKYSP